MADRRESSIPVKRTLTKRGDGLQRTLRGKTKMKRGAVRRAAPEQVSGDPLLAGRGQPAPPNNSDTRF
eukprot:7290038-Prorocentrum_lima.AAC.1